MFAHEGAKAHTIEWRQFSINEIFAITLRRQQRQKKKNKNKKYENYKIHNDTKGAAAAENGNKVSATCQAAPRAQSSVLWYSGNHSVLSTSFVDEHVARQLVSLSDHTARIVFSLPYFVLSRDRFSHCGTPLMSKAP